MLGVQIAGFSIPIPGRNNRLQVQSYIKTVAELTCWLQSGPEQPMAVDSQHGLCWACVPLVPCKAIGHTWSLKATVLTHYTARGNGRYNMLHITVGALTIISACDSLCE